MPKVCDHNVNLLYHQINFSEDPSYKLGICKSNREAKSSMGKFSITTILLSIIVMFDVLCCRSFAALPVKNNSYDMNVVFSNKSILYDSGSNIHSPSKYMESLDQIFETKAISTSVLMKSNSSFTRLPRDADSATSSWGTVDVSSEKPDCEVANIKCVLRKGCEGALHVSEIRVNITILFY